MYSIIYIDVIQLYIYVLNGQAIIHTVINRGFSRLQRIISKTAQAVLFVVLRIVLVSSQRAKIAAQPSPTGSAAARPVSPKILSRMNMKGI